VHNLAQRPATSRYLETESLNVWAQLDEVCRRGVSRICDMDLDLAKLAVVLACGLAMCAMMNFSIETSMAKPRPMES